jgi:tRNA(Arg) A34 adenosine deaminase TadA
MIYKDDLQRVYAVIEREQNWMKITYNDAEWDANDCDLLVKAPSCFCLAGAFLHVRFPDDHGYVFKMSRELDEFASSFGMDTNELFEFNDSHAHAEVLALLKSAIDRAPVRPS